MSTNENINEAVYFIKHCTKGYLHRRNDSRWELVDNKLSATRLTYDKAVNVIKNSISPTTKKNYSIIKAEFAEVLEPLPTEHSGSFDWNELSTVQYNLFKKLYVYEENLKAELSYIDREICDIQHYIEFFSLDAAKGYKAYRLLKERLAKRREIKNELAKTACFIDASSADFSEGKVKSKISSIDNQKYTPRIHNELFGMDIGSKGQHFGI